MAHVLLDHEAVHDESYLFEAVHEMYLFYILRLICTDCRLCYVQSDTDETIYCNGSSTCVSVALLG